MRIYIPSRKRTATLKDRTLAQIPDTWLGQTTIVVCNDEVAEYRRSLDYNPKFKVVSVIGCEPGIAMTRMCIGRDAANANSQTFLMLDDDLKFFQRKGEDDYHLLPTTEGQREIMFDSMMKTLTDYAHVAFSSREGNNHLPMGVAPCIVQTTRALRALGFQTKAFNDCEHGRVEVMEDFDIQLQLLRKGYPNAVLAYWAHDQQMTNASGGCSLYRDHAMQEASAQKLHDLHPNFVKLRTKQNKTDKSGFGTRTEVTVYWKKALESAHASN